MRKWIMLIITTMILITVSTGYAIDGFTLSGGKGKPDNLAGGRVGLQWKWDTVWFADSPWSIHGYWDASAAYWQTDGDYKHHNKSIAIVAGAPVFRLQKTQPLSFGIQPYLEGSVGLALMSADRLGHRDLGAPVAFQDLIGLGFQFGDHQQYDMSAHYLHYSNANLFQPNNGIDVKYYLTFGYHFS